MCLLICLFSLFDLYNSQVNPGEMRIAVLVICKLNHFVGAFVQFIHHQVNQVAEVVNFVLPFH